MKMDFNGTLNFEFVDYNDEALKEFEFDW